MSLINRLLAEMSKRQDLVFAFFFVMIVVMLVFPLPTWLVDGLLAVNLTVSLVILISATYLKHPLEMSSFPSIILLTSMLRVAMSVATTRLILATGDAGQLIVAFGEFVIGGNLVVGLVIFLIIATVQFMVVTKGAERISEVSARFTLDALPASRCRSTMTHATATSPPRRPATSARPCSSKCSSTARWTAPCVSSRAMPLPA